MKTSVSREFTFFDHSRTGEHCLVREHVIGHASYFNQLFNGFSYSLKKAALPKRR